MSGEGRKRRALADRERFGFQRLAGKNPREMRHGKKQRVAAIKAMVTRPGPIFADEPTPSLDDESAKVFLNLVGGSTVSRPQPRS